MIADRRSPRPEAARAPDVFEPLLGYRLWRVSANGTLRCLTSRVRWEPGVNRARCWRHDHEAPARMCGCGFNALHHLSDVPGRDHGRHLALGAIAAWGMVDVHRLGFRAQYARVLALARGGVDHAASEHRLTLAAQRHGVPLVAVELLAADAGRYALPVTPSLLPGRHA